MMELLTRSHPCRWNILTIVSRGCSIVAQIQRFSQYISEDFTFSKKQTNHQYARILYDYFDNDTQLGNMINGHTQLNELNNECRETHIEIVIRLCMLFESMVRYALDFLNYLEQLSHDYFLQMSIASLLNETDGK
jgi:hypothetical protein